LKRLLSLALSLGLAMAACTCAAIRRPKHPPRHHLHPPPPRADARPADSAGNRYHPADADTAAQSATIDPEALATQPVILPDPPPVNPSAPRPPFPCSQA
jgi:hypothetical protein